MGALLEVEATISEMREPKFTCKPLTFFEVPSGYRPGWSLASSFVLQAGALALVTFLALAPTPFARPSRLRFVNVIDLSTPDRIIFLPSVGGGSEGNSAGRGNSRAMLAPPVHSSDGFSYPGPQAIVSDPPEAFNPTQTLLRPALKDLPALQEFVPLPTAVEMASAGTEAAPPRIVVKPSTRLTADDAVAPKIQMQPPKLMLPVSTTTTMPALAAPDPPAISKAEGPDAKNLISLTAIPAPPDLPAKFPSAEARGRFAISPEAMASVSQPAPGGSFAGMASTSAGIGNRNDIAAADAARARAALAGGSAGQFGPASGAITANGSGKGNGSGDAGSGVTIGRGAGGGVGIGSGSGSSSASGAGSGNAGGSGPFAGISIQGGRYTGGTSANLHPTLAPRTAYGMTIVSTASSGGGLADFGVFSNEKVYTVFMDMRESGDEHVAAWTLQYAAISSAEDPLKQGVVVAPSPLIRPRPQLPTPLLHKYPHAVVVLSALLGSTGHLEEISVKQTPDAQLIPAILAALNNWSFQPAEVDGQPVPIKILLGIPLQ
jgi:TonB-like protein